MNPVEIEEAVSALAELAFDAAEFPYAFLQAFGNKETTIKRVRSGTSNKSDLGGVLQTNNIHILVSPSGEVSKFLTALKASPGRPERKPALSLPPTARSWRPRTWRPARRSPVPIQISPITSVSFCRWRASAPSSKSAIARSTSGRPAALTGSIELFWKKIPIGIPPTAGRT